MFGDLHKLWTICLWRVFYPPAKESQGGHVHHKNGHLHDSPIGAMGNTICSTRLLSAAAVSLNYVKPNTFLPFSVPHMRYVDLFYCFSHKKQKLIKHKTCWDNNNKPNKLKLKKNECQSHSNLITLCVRHAKNRERESERTNCLYTKPWEV